MTDPEKIEIEEKGDYSVEAVSAICISKIFFCRKTDDVWPIRIVEFMGCKVTITNTDICVRAQAYLSLQQRRED